MAIYRFAVTSVGRGSGRRATAAAAYRAGEKIRDVRSGQVYNHSARQDVVHKEIFLPSQFDGRQISWARDRATLWNTAELTEKRRNSRVAREYQLALPPELNAEQRRDLARSFSGKLADRYQVAVDLAIHDPRPTGDLRNFHAHLLTTTRTVTMRGLGAKTGLDQSSQKHEQHWRYASRKEFIALREQWAILTNDALRKANVNALVDHRTLEAQGIKREPRATIPWAAYRMEQKGLHSDVAERVRERYRAFVQARRERYAAQSAQVVQPSIKSRDLTEVQRQARENWKQLRMQSLNNDRNQSKASELSQGIGSAAKRRDYDFGL